MKATMFDIAFVSSQSIASNVKHLTFKSQKIFEFIPGQFVTLFFNDKNGKLHPRNYSITNMFEKSTLIEIAISYIKDGVASDTLFKIKVGQILKARGPFGNLTLPLVGNFKKIILVGTGTGIAPYRSMLPSIEKLCEKNACKIYIILGVQYRADILYKDDFYDFANRNRSLTFITCFSRENDKLHSYEYKGYVQHQFKNLHLNQNSDIVYLCGNPSMIDESYNILTETMNFDSKMIRREKYTSSKIKKD